MRSARRRSIPDNIDLVCKFLVIVIATWWVVVVAHAWAIGSFTKFAGGAR